MDDRWRSNLRMLLRLWEVLAPYRANVAAVTVLALLTAALGLTSPYLMKLLVDNVLISGGSVTLMMALAGTLVVAEVLGLCCTLMKDHLANWIATRVVRDVRIAALGALERLPLRYYDTNETGVIVSRISREADNLRFTLNGIWTLWAQNTCEIVVSAALMLWLDWRLAVIAIAPIIIILTAMPSVTRYVGDGYRRDRMESDRLSGRLTEVLSCIRAVRLFRAHRRETDYLADRTRAVSRARFSRVDLGWVTQKFYARAGSAVGPLLVWTIGGLRVLSGDISVGTLVAFIAYVRILYVPTWGMLEMFASIGQSFVVAEKIFAIIDHPEATHAGATASAIAPQEIRGEVVLRDVWFGYREGHPVLKGINLTVQPGECIGIVGPTGAGKSTLMKLACGFYQPDQGQVLIDGTPMIDYQHEELVRFIGTVPQDCQLLSGSIAENIAYGSPGATSAQIVQAAMLANAHEFISRLPQAYDTQVGSQGALLSGGERQRVSIARAILADPRILILDEPTSSVDLETEEKIQSALDHVIRGRTVFAIAHRLSTLRKADRLIFVDDGRILEEGTHDELMRIESGRYRRMVDLHRRLSEVRVIG